MLRINSDGMVEGARYVPSPNRDERPAGCAVRLIVLHAISLPPGEFGGPGIEQLFSNRLDPAAHPYYAAIATTKLSAHFLIRRDGELVQFVPCGERAWHAGESSWKGITRCNDFSIGIELEGTDSAPFESAQYETLAALTRALRARYPIEDMAGHSDVAPGRKTDPGPHFDWGRYRAMAARDSCSMDVVRASPRDYAAVLRLQAANFAPNLTPQEREGGFLSAEFTLPQIVAIADDLGVFVARDVDRVVAYVCAHRPDLAPVPPLIEAMFACARSAAYRGRALAGARVFTYGTV